MLTIVSWLIIDENLCQLCTTSVLHTPAHSLWQNRSSTSLNSQLKARGSNACVYLVPCEPQDALVCVWNFLSFNLTFGALFIHYKYPGNLSSTAAARIIFSFCCSIFLGIWLLFPCLLGYEGGQASCQYTVCGDK